jgi:putative transposase
LRKDKLVEGQVYHVFTRSIAGYKIFNDSIEYERMQDLIQYYQSSKPVVKFSRFLKLPKDLKNSLGNDQEIKNAKLVEIISYCLMPTHLHFVLKQIRENGISVYMNRMLNSYTRYFNIKHGRKGPLWEARFKSVLTETDQQLLHLTRYVHLNPATAKIVENPVEWSFSSYREYLDPGTSDICTYQDVLMINPNTYKEFVEDRIGYQRELAEIKALLLE